MQGNGIHVALAPGHTLSHQIVHIIGGSKQAVLLGDALVSGALQFTNPPADDNHKHFGGGQTETTVELAPGEHTLQLVLGDWSHIPYYPPVMSEMCTTHWTAHLKLPLRRAKTCSTG